MFKTSRIIALSSAAALGATTLVACGGSGSEKAETNADGAVVVDFWHSSSGAPGETLKELVDQFNEEHKGEIEIRATYQGKYQDAISKFIASVQANDLPDLLQASDVQSAYLKDSKLAIPAEELNEEFGGDYDFGDLNGVVANYYTMDDTVYSMPAMVSQPALYVNNTMLAEAGVKPEDLATVTGLFEAVEKIHAQTGVAGLSFHQSGWFVEQFAAASGQLFCTPDNGVGDETATEFAINSPENVKLWEKIGELYASGAIFNPGNDGSASAGAFQSGQAAILLNSSGGYGDVSAGTDFDWSMLPLPSENDKAGAVPGGNSLWAIGEGKDKETQEATWEFMEFIGSDEAQTKLFTETGYLPTTKSAAEELSGLSPQQQGLIEQLTDTSVSTVTAGCHSGAMNDARSSYTEAISAISSGVPAKDALDKAQQGADASIESYIKRTKN